MLTDSQIAYNREKIISLLRRTKRPNIEDVVNYLDDNDFFIAPSSATHHHNWKGGLAQHSLEVYMIVRRKDYLVPSDSLIIASLLHDVCKIHQFYIDSKGIIRSRSLHVKGHGSRSVWILHHICFALREDELLTIRWHMHRRSDDNDDPGWKKARHSNLWKLVHDADVASACCRHSFD